jgi:hypothetical protein
LLGARRIARCFFTSEFRLNRPQDAANLFAQLRYTPIYSIFLLSYFCETQHNNPLRFPQKHSRTARLERVALLVVFSPQSFA